MRSLMRVWWLVVSGVFLFATPEAQKIVEAREAYHRQDYAGAERLYQSMIRSDKNNAQYRFELGMVYIAQERYSMAKITLERAVSINKEHLLANYNLAKIYTQLHKDDQAILIYQFLIDRYPHFPPSYLNLANIELQRDSYNVAKTLYSQVIVLDKNITEAYVGLILIALKEKQWQEAEGYLEQWQNVAPDDPRISEWKVALADALMPN